MNFNIKAVVLRQKTYLENEKYLNLLTKDRGILTAKCKVSGHITRAIYKNIHICGYYNFNIYSGKYGMIVDSVEAISHFFKLNLYPEKFALSQYFCELSYLLNLSNKKSSDHLRLLLNSIWSLEKQNGSCVLIKCVFELRLLSISGYMPNLVCCKFCCKYEADVMFFCLSEGFLVCDRCLKKASYFKDIVKISKTVLYAMRYIIYKEEKYIFNFRLDEASIEIISKLVEDMILNNIEKEPKTLKIYKELYI